MQLEIVNKDTYKHVEGQASIAFDEVWFHELNKYKVDAVDYLLFKTNKYKAGLIIGIDKGIVKVPYSAPFGTFEFFESCTMEQIDDILKCFNEYTMTHKISKIYLKLPPVFYDEPSISKLVNALIRDGYRIYSMDLDYYFPITDMEKYYLSLHRNARKCLKNALKHEYKLRHCETEEEKYTAYKIIEESRKSKNYYLSMTWEQVRDTIAYIRHDFFILVMDGEEVASAIVFKVADNTNQVIYWGDLPGFADKRPMNLLAYTIYEYYWHLGLGFLDIGPSTMNGIPNYGLCDFKESIGCLTSNKFIFCKEVQS